MTTPILVCNKPTSTFRLPARSQFRIRQRGFTLLEILLVLAIMALGAVIVIPNVSSLEGRGFNAQVRHAHTLLNYARRTAVVSGHPASIAFAVSQDTDQEQTLRLARDNVGLWQFPEAELTFMDSTEQETDIEALLEVSFFPEGGSTGGTLVFAQGRQRAEIHIDPFTGRVELLNEEAR